MRSSLPRVLRRYCIWIYLTLVTLVVAYVPLVPYSPYCWDKEFGVGPIVLAPEFRDRFAARLSSFEVPYVRVGRVVVIRVWDWFADPDDWVINASNKSFYSFLEPLHGADVAHLPPHIRDLVAESEREHGYLNLTCELVRAVAIDGW